MKDCHIEQLKKNDTKKIVVFDDDPTGSQTVNGIPLYLEFNQEIITEAMNDKSTKGFYILTNTRAMNESDTIELNRELCGLVDQCSKKYGIDYEIISRGDSTLRGHFPLELQVIEDGIDKEIHGYILMPFFEEGGRITMNDIHYVTEDDQLIPVGDTQFSKDHTFGFTSSNLKEYVVEKYRGKMKTEDVYSISIDMLRDNIEDAYQILKSMDGHVCIVNAQTYDDVDSFVRILLRAEKEGKNFLFRTAASFVKKRLFLEDKELFSPSEFGIDNSKGGIIVVGSYVDKTTKQLNYLKENGKVEVIALDVNNILDNNNFDSSYKDCAKIIEENIKRGLDTVISTSRMLIRENKKYTALEIGNIVSNYLSNIVNSITEKPSYVVAKGGITSHDIAYKGLHIRKAMVQGQIIPGVPVWTTGDESNFPDLLYVVFPGNVGDEKDLFNVVNKLRKV